MAIYQACNFWCYYKRDIWKKRIPGNLQQPFTISADCSIFSTKSTRKSQQLLQPQSTIYLIAKLFSVDQGALGRSDPPIL